jgi:hypothetical protein
VKAGREFVHWTPQQLPHLTILVRDGCFTEGFKLFFLTTKNNGLKVLTSVFGRRYNRRASYIPV